MINKTYSNDFKGETLLLFISSNEFKEFVKNKWYSISSLGNNNYRLNVYEVK